MKEKCMSTTMFGEKAYTTNDISHNLSKNIETVRRWIRLGKLNAHLCGGYYYVLESDLNKFLMNKTKDGELSRVTAAGRGEINE